MPPKPLQTALFLALLSVLPWAPATAQEAPGAKQAQPPPDAGPLKGVDGRADPPVRDAAWALGIAALPGR